MKMAKTGSQLKGRGNGNGTLDFAAKVRLGRRNNSTRSKCGHHVTFGIARNIVSTAAPCCCSSELRSS